MTNEMNSNETRLKRKNENSLVKKSAIKTQRKSTNRVKIEHKEERTAKTRRTETRKLNSNKRDLEIQFKKSNL